MHRDIELSELVHGTLSRHGAPGTRLDPDRNFFEAGLTSVALACALADLHELGPDLVPEVTLLDLFRFPTVRLLTIELLGRLERSTNTSRPPRGALPWEQRSG